MKEPELRNDIERAYFYCWKAWRIDCREDDAELLSAVTRLQALVFMKAGRPRHDELRREIQIYLRRVEASLTPPPLPELTDEALARPSKRQLQGRIAHALAHAHSARTDFIERAQTTTIEEERLAYQHAIRYIEDIINYLGHGGF